MPRVPDVDSRVRQAAAPNFRFKSRANAGQFGGHTAAAISDAASTAQKVSNRLRAEQEKAQKEAEEALITEKKAELDNLLTNELHNPETGFMNTRGKVSADQFIPSQTRFRSGANAISKTIENPELAKRFELAVQARDNLFTRTAGTHFAVQAQAIKAKANEDGIMASRRVASLGYKQLGLTESELLKQEAMLTKFMGDKVEPETLAQAKANLRDAQYIENLSQAFAAPDGPDLPSIRNMLNSDNVIKFLNPRSLKSAREALDEGVKLSTAIGNARDIIDAPDDPAQKKEWVRTADLSRATYDVAVAKMEDLYKDDDDGLRAGISQLKEQYAGLRDLQKETQAIAMVGIHKEIRDAGSLRGKRAFLQMKMIEQPDLEVPILELLKGLDAQQSRSIGSGGSADTSSIDKLVEAQSDRAALKLKTGLKIQMDLSRNPDGTVGGIYSGPRGRVALERDLLLGKLSVSDQKEVLSHYDDPAIDTKFIVDSYKSIANTKVQPSEAMVAEFMKLLLFDPDIITGAKPTRAEVHKRMKFLLKQELTSGGKTKSAIGSLQELIAGDNDFFLGALPNIEPGTSEFNDIVTAIVRDPRRRSQFNKIETEQGKIDFVRVVSRELSGFRIRRGTDDPSTPEIDESLLMNRPLGSPEFERQFRAAETSQEIEIALRGIQASEGQAATMNNQKRKFELAVGILGDQIADREARGELIVDDLQVEIETAAAEGRFPEFFTQALQRAYGNSESGKAAYQKYIDSWPTNKDAFASKLINDANVLLKQSVKSNSAFGI